MSDTDKAALAAERESRKALGVSGRIPATKVLMKDVPFDHADTRAQSWLLINEQEGAFTQVNTYNGKTGKNYDAAKATYQIKDLAKSLKKWTKAGYAEVAVAECSVAEVIEVTSEVAEPVAAQ